MKARTNQPEPRQDAEAFRRWLQRELAERCEANPQYSLRAFARDLDVDHSSLSQILRGRRRLSERVVLDFGRRLGIEEAALAAVVQSLPLDRAGPRDERAIRRLTSDTFEAIADWQHYALLELTHLEQFRPNLGWIARVLDLEADEVQAIVARLLRLGLLHMPSRERWEDRLGAAVADQASFRDAALHNLQDRLQERFLAALSDTDRPTPCHHQLTLAMDRRRLPEIVVRIGRFVEELGRLLALDPEKNEVYQLDVRFFSLTDFTADERHAAIDTPESPAPKPGENA